MMTATLHRAARRSRSPSVLRILADSEVGMMLVVSLCGGQLTKCPKLAPRQIRGMIQLESAPAYSVVLERKYYRFVEG
jgi:hypothetical protein